MCQTAKQLIVWTKKKSTKRTAISKRRRRRRKNYSQIDLETDSEKKVQNVLQVCQNGQKCYFLNQKKVKQKDSKYKKSSLAGQSNCKSTKEKSKLLVKCFVKSLKKMLQYLLEMWQNCLKCHVLNQEKSQRKG